MIEFPEIEPALIEKVDAIFGDPRGRPIEALQTLIELFNEIARKPFAPYKLKLPAIPPAKEGDQAWVPGESHFRRPGSPAVEEESQFPVNELAAVCSTIATRLLNEIEDPKEKVRSSLIGDAMFLAIRVPIILDWYNGVHKENVQAKERRSARQADNARSRAALNKKQLSLVGAYVRKKFNAGVSVSEACQQASAQLRTGTFHGINGRIPIGEHGLRKYWPEWRKLNHH